MVKTAIDILFFMKITSDLLLFFGLAEDRRGPEKTKRADTPLTIHGRYAITLPGAFAKPSFLICLH